jgi:hypothetical protein
MGKRHTVHCDIDVSCIEGVAVELRHVLPHGWTLKQEADTFVVCGEQIDDWQDRLWFLIRFVAHPAFLSLQQTHKDASEVRYELVSSNQAGRGFRVELILTNPNA